jgi:hypothetical protein
MATVDMSRYDLVF